MAALLHGCMGAGIANSQQGRLRAMGSDDDQRGRGAPRFNRRTSLLQDGGREREEPTNPHPHTRRVQATVISSWLQEQAQPSSLLPLPSLSPPSLLLLACCPPAFLPSSSAQPSPAQPQPEPEAEPFLQLMRTRSASLLPVTSPCPTYDIITNAASSLSLCVSRSQSCLPDPTGWLSHRVTWPIAAGYCS